MTIRSACCVNNYIIRPLQLLDRIGEKMKAKNKNKTVVKRKIAKELILSFLLFCPILAHADSNSKENANSLNVHRKNCVSDCKIDFRGCVEYARSSTNWTHEEKREALNDCSDKKEDCIDYCDSKQFEADLNGQN